MKKDTCNDCNSTELNLDTNTHDIVCSACGLVQDAYTIDPGPDWSDYGDGATDGERTGMPSTHLLHDKGLTTAIDWRNRDAMGGSLSGTASRLANKLRRQQRRTRMKDSRERNLAVALNEIQRIGSRMDLPKSTRSESAFIYKKAVDKKLVRGRSIEGVAAACIYMTCRIHHIPRTLDEIGLHSRTGRKEIGRTYRALAKELKVRVPPSSASDYIPRLCSSLSLSGKTQLQALRIHEEAVKSGQMNGCGPTGIAAAAVYLSSKMSDNRKDERTQRQISEAAGVTEVTIRNRFKELCLIMEWKA
jgi:transcription initiation factor TFIIB|tara:strand:- start:4935 stop:5843 length:909 start_codon:yes stop_codon:yes gene_type:complete